MATPITRPKQISDSLGLGLLLALSGGFMDAYSYIARGHVFANAQTGNLLLLGVHLSQGNFSVILRYSCPVISFVLGIALAYQMRTKNWSLLHWRQVCVLIEALVLLYVGTLPQSHNLMANSLTSFACGIQVQSFRTIYGNGIATTMCIGNLRSGTHHLCTFFQTHRLVDLKKSLLYYLVILIFVTGAVIGNVCVKQLQEQAILVCFVVLILAFLIMFIDLEKRNTP